MADSKQDHQLRSLLIKAGVSSSGATQFARGLPVKSDSDRKLIAAVMGKYVASFGSAKLDLRTLADKSN